MSIFSKFSDIINANILHMIEKAEDPEKIVRLMIQEMEDTLVDVKSSAAKVIAEKKNMERQIALIRDDQRRWLEKAELAISKNRDDLAKGALGEKAKKSELEATLSAELSEVDDNLIKFKADIQQLEGKLREAKNKQKTLLIRKNTALSQRKIQNRIYEINAQSAFTKFEQFEKNLDRLEGEVEAFSVSGQNNLEDEFRKLENETTIESELAALKEKLMKKE